MSFVADIVGEVLGHALLELVLKPLHWIAWATGVLAATLLSFGRFQAEPWDDEEDWVPEEGRPILTTFGATMMGSGLWAIAIAALVRAAYL